MADNAKAMAKAARKRQLPKKIPVIIGEAMTATLLAASTEPPALAACSPVASSKAPVLVAPSPVAMTKPPALAARIPVASSKAPVLVARPVAMTKPPALVAPSPVAMTKPPALAARSPIASSKAPVLLAPSPVASSKAPVLVAPSPVAMTKPPALAARSPVTSSKAPVLLAPSPVAMTKAPVLVAPSPVAMTKPPAPALAARSPVASSKAPVLVAPSPVAMTKPPAPAPAARSPVASSKAPVLVAPSPVAMSKPSIAAMMVKHDRDDDGGDKRAAGSMDATVAQAEDESKATDQQQYKRLRYSVSPAPVASTKTPAAVTPSPVASTKSPATHPFTFSTKAPIAAPRSIASSTKAPAPAAPSPVAIAKPVTVANPPTSTVAANREPDERTVGATEEEDWINLDVAKKRLQCAVCSSPLKPPIFQCEEGHVVCSACCGGGGPNKHCIACGDYDGRVATYRSFSYMDGLVGDCRAPCPYKKFGCSTATAYHEAAEHKVSCSYAPCYCLEEECVFEGSPTMLLRHLTAAGGRHSWPVENLNYETVYQFTVEASEHRCLLVAEEDGRVFLLAVGDGSGTAGVRPVTVVCVRGSPDGRPLYKGVLWVDGPPAAAAGDIRKESKLSAKVGSCAVPGEVDMDHGQLLVHVDPSFLHDGESPELHIRLCIIKLP